MLMDILYILGQPLTIFVLGSASVGILMYGVIKRIELSRDKLENPEKYRLIEEEKAKQPRKSHAALIFLSVFLGGIGADRFYMRNTLSGFIKLLSFGGFGILYILDIILALTNSMEDENGNKAI